MRDYDDKSDSIDVAYFRELICEKRVGTYVIPQAAKIS